MPWLAKNFNDGSLTLEGSSIIKVSLDIDDVYDIKEILRIFTDNDLNINKKHTELENKNVEIFTGRKIVGSREINTEIAWIKKLIVKINQLKDFIGQFLLEREGEGRHP
jgi:hypothetical protein